MKWGLTLGIGLLALAGTAVTANAADIPARPVYKAVPMPEAVYNWTGIYVGVNGGYAQGKLNWVYVAGGIAHHTTKGGLFGGTLGAQIQSGQWVFGAEGDFDWARIRGSTFCPNPAFTCDSDLRTFGTARVRVGFSPSAAPNWLFYATGGAAFGDQRIQTVFLPGTPIPTSGTPINGSNTSTLGWTVGAGVEWAPFPTMPRWTTKFEYLYYDLGTHGYVVDNLLAVNAHHTGNIIRAGINFRLWP